MNKHMFLVIFNFFLTLFIILPVTGSPIEDLHRYFEYLDGKHEKKEHWSRIHIQKDSSGNNWETSVSSEVFLSKYACEIIVRQLVRDSEKSPYEHRHLCGKNCKYDATGITCEVLCGSVKCLENQKLLFHFKTINVY